MFGLFRPTYSSNSAFEFRHYKYPQVFQPGDEVSLSVAFAGQFKGDRELAILFCQPGTYELKAGGFEPRTDKDVRISSAPIPVVVKAPKGDDKAIVEQLTEDETLVYALLSSFEQSHQTLL